MQSAFLRLPCLHRLKALFIPATLPLVLLCFLSLDPGACAQTPLDTYVWTNTVGGVTTTSPAFSGGTITHSGRWDPPAAYPDRPYAPSGGSYGAGDQRVLQPGQTSGAICSGPISTTYTWNGPDPAPPAGSVIVEEQADVKYSASSSMNIGTGDATLDTSKMTQTSDTVSRGGDEKQGVYWHASGGSSFALTDTPHASCEDTAQGPGGVNVNVTYTPTVYPVTINPVGATKDSSGKWNILIGQGCAPSLQGLPTGFQATNLQWTATGNTLQNWTGGEGGQTAAIIGAANPYTFTQTNLTSTEPSWAWSDNAGQKTITCTATVTPPTGQGPSFPVTATLTIALVAPPYGENDLAGATRVDNQDPLITGYALWAGASGTIANGSQWNDSVTTPTPFASGGDWAHLQIISPSGTVTPAGSVPDNGQIGLDGAFPYNKAGLDFVPNGIEDSEGDSPGIGLSNSNTEYNLNYSFDLYVMYLPPDGGAGAIWVPLTKLTWTWKPDVYKPSGGWSTWPAGTAPGGNPSVPAMGTRCITEPTWTQIISGN